MNAGPFGLVLCGLGPAGAGVLVAAARVGRLREMLDQGVAAFDARPVEQLGGSLRDYRIRANSFAEVFLESLDEPGSRELLAGLANTPQAQDLRAARRTYPPLELAGAFTDLVSRRVAEVLERHPRCSLTTATTVTAIDVRDHGVVVRDAAGRETLARVSVICLGGEPVADTDDGVVARLLKVWTGARAVVGDDAVRNPAALVAARHVTVLGGSHTAWAVAARCLTDASDVRVALVQRRPPPLYFQSRADARAAGYAFDDVGDVCPLSGRVHRFGGLRGPARELAASSSDRLDVHTLPGPWTPELLRDLVPVTDLVVPCLGYRARLPEISIDGELLDRRRAESLVGTDGGASAPGSGLFAHGLGAGLRPLPAAGGEPAYAGRLDGVWLYQHDAGDVMVQRVMDRLDRAEVSA